MKTRSGRGKKSLEPVRRSPAKGRKSRSARRRISRLAVKPESETIVLSDSEGDENQPTVGCVEDDIQVIDIADVTQEVAAPRVRNVSAIIGDYVTAQPTTSPKPVVRGRASGISSSDPPVIILGDEPDPVVPDDDGVEVVAVVVSSRTSLLGRSLNRRKSGSLSQMQDAIKKAKSTIRRQSTSTNRSSSRNVLNGIAANSRQIQRGKRKKQKQKNQQFQGVNAFHRNRRQEDLRRVVYRIDNHPNPDGSGPWARIGGNVPTMQNRNGNFSFEAIPFIPFASSTPAQTRPNLARERCGPWIQKSRHNNNGRPRPPLPFASGSNFMNAPRPPIPAIAPGSNIMNVGTSEQRPPGSLRPIVIDGSNVAFGHGERLGMGKPQFSAKGIQMCVDYFLKRGHKEIIAFVPAHNRKKLETLDPQLLGKMEKDGYVRFTPSREVGGQRIASYDDLFVLDYAREVGGIVVSNDNFRDIYNTHERLHETIRNRVIQAIWITKDCVMFPEDPLGRNGPSLDDFLKF